MCEKTKEERIERGRVVFGEAKELAFKIGTMLHKLRVEDTMGIIALSLVLNSSIKVSMLLEEQTGNDEESTSRMIRIILETLMLDVGIVGYKNLHEYMKEKSCGSQN